MYMKINLRKPTTYINAEKQLLILIVFLLSLSTFAQNSVDSSKENRWSFHYQNTIIYQYHPDFTSPYSGENSLLASEKSTLSISATAYLGVRLWKNAFAYYNPEITGGSGFSQTRGVAGFPNGEVYRVDKTAPGASSARYYIRQLFALSHETTMIDDGLNQVKSKIPTSYISITAGKFSILDFYDNNKYAHDPRAQFYNWALMGNGAWDYPANTKGYTFGGIIELVKPQWAIRYCMVTVPKVANGPIMDKDIRHANSNALEYEHKYKMGTQSGNIRFIGFYTLARMGHYKDALIYAQNGGNIAHAINALNKSGNTKYGIGVNIDHTISQNVGLFFRSSINDGLHETWAFTEIDRAISLGAQFNGQQWNRPTDKIGVALLANGLSKDHRNYLAAGGYGFIIGDGKLHYQPEMVAEIYYSFNVLHSPFTLSPDYQFIMNPGYNKDRGPVHAFGLRAHAEF
jgi:high affinity Mn2+ porin